MGGIEKNPLYIEGDPNQDIAKLLEQWYSKSIIKQLIKSDGIKTGRPHLDEVWIKIGKQLIIIQKKLSYVATQAQINWEYHYQLMPKTIKWELFRNRLMVVTSDSESENLGSNPGSEAKKSKI